MLWMGKGSHRPIICSTSLQSMLGRCLPCYEGEGFIALLWLMGERQNDPDAANRSQAVHFSLTVKPHAWRRKSTLSVMLLPGNTWREGTTRALPSHRLGRPELQRDARSCAGRQRRKQESRREQAGHPHPTHSGGGMAALRGVASVFGTALSRVASAWTCFVCVVGRDWSINNTFHGEVSHSGKQKLRWEIPRTSWSKCKPRGGSVTSAPPCQSVAGFGCVGGVKWVRSRLWFYLRSVNTEWVGTGRITLPASESAMLHTGRSWQSEVMIELHFHSRFILCCSSA